MSRTNMKEPAITLIGPRCTGCEACVQICPTQALTMEMDAEGFFYPVVSQDCCSRCGVCAGACPVANPGSPARTTLPDTALAGSHKQEGVLLSSTSGGAFSAIVAAAGPDAVYGTAWTAPDTAVCVCAAPENLAPLRGSKYVQGRVDGAFLRVQRDLENRRRVLFSGTPCQVAGLLSFLDTRRVDRDGLITVELICHGAASPGLFRRYCAMKSRQYRSPVTEFTFREKSREQV